MVYAYAAKGNRRHPYCVCRNTQQKGWATRSSKSLAAQAIEESVVRRIRESQGGIAEGLEWEQLDRSTLELLAHMHQHNEKRETSGSGRWSTLWSAWRSTRPCGERERLRRAWADTGVLCRMPILGREPSSSHLAILYGTAEKRSQPPRDGFELKSEWLPKTNPVTNWFWRNRFRPSTMGY
jgi:hypothetical protein